MKLAPGVRAFFHLQVAKHAYSVCDTPDCPWRGRATSGRYCSDCGQPAHTRHRDIDKFSAIPDQVRPFLKHLKFSYADSPRNHDLYTAPDGAVPIKPGSVLTVEGIAFLCETIVNDDEFWEDLRILESAYDRLEFVAVVE